jgi:hypothetical protein
LKKLEKSKYVKKELNNIFSYNGFIDLNNRTYDLKKANEDLDKKLVNEINK